MTELDSSEHYIKMQNKFRVHIGDSVKIFRSCKSCENGWQNSWVNDMYNYVGNTYSVSSIHDNGIGLGDYRFPYFVLEILR